MKIRKVDDIDNIPEKTLGDLRAGEAFFFKGSDTIKMKTDEGRVDLRDGCHWSGDSRNNDKVVIVNAEVNWSSKERK